MSKGLKINFDMKAQPLSKQLSKQGFEIINPNNKLLYQVLLDSLVLLEQHIATEKEIKELQRRYIILLEMEIKNV